MADVFLHIGLAKTGTTTIQAALDARVDPLAAAGVLFAGGSHRAQRLAAYDLLGQRVEGDDRDVVAGAFGRVADEIAAFTGRRVVVSEEELSHARPRHVRRLTRRLGPHRVFVVITVRDLARTLVSSWQQSVVQGGTTPWNEFIASVRDEDVATAPSDGLAFWLRQDLLRVIDTWTTVVPTDRIRIVTVPPPGSGEHVLLDRFAAATGLPPDVWGAEPVSPRNVSLGAAELELVRRLNQATSGRLTIAQYRFVMEAGLRPRWHVQHPRPLRLPAEHLPWARERGERLAAELRSRGHPVVGDLSDLVPGPATCGDRPDRGHPRRRAAGGGGGGRGRPGPRPRRPLQAVPTGVLRTAGALAVPRGGHGQLEPGGRVLGEEGRPPRCRPAPGARLGRAHLRAADLACPVWRLSHGQAP